MMKVKLHGSNLVVKARISPEIKYIGINKISIDGEDVPSSGFSVNYKISNSVGQSIENLYS